MATQAQGPPPRPPRDAVRRLRRAARAADQELAAYDEALEKAEHAENFGTYHVRPDQGLDGARRFLAAARRQHPDQELTIHITAR